VPQPHPVPTPNTVPASLDPKSPLYHTRAKVNNSKIQLYNAHIQTKRYPNPGKGGIVHVFKEPWVEKNGKDYSHIAWGGKPDGGWARYDFLTYV
jgi:hypothetical protein